MGRENTAGHILANSKSAKTHIQIDRKEILANRFIQSEQKIYIVIFMKERDIYIFK